VPDNKGSVARITFEGVTHYNPASTLGPASAHCCSKNPLVKVIVS
jgi:hypothetical protein